MNFLEILMVSDKTIRKAFIINQSLEWILMVSDKTIHKAFYN